jgi:hypothetical protein
MLWIAIALVSLMFYFRAFGGQNTIHYMEPFLFGAIGSLIYLYKALNECHTNRTFEPSKMTTDRLRLFMGALSGGLIVNLFDPGVISGVTEAAQTASGAAPKNATFSAAALGFLAGYSVDFFYGTLDRLIKNLLPPSRDPVDNTKASTPVPVPKPAPLPEMNLVSSVPCTIPDAVPMPVSDPNMTTATAPIEPENKTIKG